MSEWISQKTPSRCSIQTALFKTISQYLRSAGWLCTGSDWHPYNRSDPFKPFAPLQDFISWGPSQTYLVLVFDFEHLSSLLSWCAVLKEDFLSPCFPHSLFLIFLLFSSANLFKLLSPFSSFSFIDFQTPVFVCSWGPAVCLCMCVHTCVCVCLCVGFFLAQCCHTEHSTLYTKDSSSRKEREEREREWRGKKWTLKADVYAGPFGLGLLCRQMYQLSGMRVWERETSMSTGTTGYYRDPSRGSAQASEPAGGRDRAGWKERRMTAMESWWGWRGWRQQKKPTLRCEKTWDGGMWGAETEEMAWEKDCGKI